MTAYQTKFFKRKEVSFPILLGIFGVSTLSVLHLFGVFSHAAPIADDNKVTVDGVENVGQYLTSLVLHAPSSSQLITIQYDKTLDALRVNGRINADALVIDAGQKDNNSSVQGNTLFGGMGNSVDGKTSNNLIVGGENNSIKNFVNGNDRDIQGKNSVVIGSTNSEIRTSDNVLNIGTMNSSFSNKTKNVAAIGGQVVTQNAQNSVALGAGKKTLASNAMLLGKSINAEAKNQIFVWSDTDAEFRPEQSSAFYVNTTNGFGLNTTTPRTKLDLANAGALKIAKTQPKHCSQSLAGITSYAGDVFCGCNGKEWIPLTSDMTPEKIAACKNLGKENCVGEVNTNANKGAPSAYPRWNHELDQWEPIGWKYSSKDPNTLGDCEYNCKLGFHPGANDPEGWLQLGACKACSEVVNKFRWKTAGTGDDNCDFTCKASFKYANEGKGKQSCSDCELGTYTENDNQDKTCKACDKPAKLWRDEPGLDPYFSGFTTKGDGANACDFDCAPRYQHFFNGKKSDKDKVSIGLNETVNGNACIFCKIGTWSAGGKNVCKDCTKKTGDISYIVGGSHYTLNRTAEYTTNGDNDNCEWKCNYGLVKRKDSCECQNTTSTHLENNGCVPNSKSVPCDSTSIPQNANPVIKNVQIAWTGTWKNGSWPAPAKCEWECKPGYKRNGNTCILKQRGKCADRYQNRLLDDLKSTDSLCDIGEKRNFGFNTATNKWEWSCVGDAGTAPCFATKRSPQGGKCGLTHYQCETSFSSVKNKDNPKLDNGWAWICSGKDGGDGAQCLECDDGYERKPNLGQGVYGGACVKNNSSGCEWDDHTSLNSETSKYVKVIYCANNSSCDSEEGRERYLNGNFYYLFMRSPKENLLYMPISYGPLHPESGITGDVEIKAEISNGIGTFRDTFGWYKVQTRKSIRIGGMNFISLTFNNQKYPNSVITDVIGSACTSYNNPECSVIINSAKLWVPKILSPDPRCWECGIDYKERKCMLKSSSPGLYYGSNYTNEYLKRFFCPYLIGSGEKVLGCPGFKAENPTSGIEILDWNRLSVAKNRGMNNRWNKPLWISLNTSGSPELKGVRGIFWDDTLSQKKCLEMHRDGLGKCIPMMEMDGLLPGQSGYSPFEINLDSGNGNHYHTSIDLNRRFREIKGIVNENGEVLRYSSMYSDKFNQVNSGSLCKINEKGDCLSELLGIDCDFFAHGVSESECRGKDPTSCRDSGYCVLRRKN